MYTYTLVLGFSSSKSPACVILRGLLNSVLKVIGDQTLDFIITVLYNSLVVKQRGESMHFALSETSCVMVNFLQGDMVMKPANIKIYVGKSTTEHNLLRCAYTPKET